jgi:hypothetical protein
MSDGQEREQDTEDNPNIDLAHLNSSPKASRGIQCRNVELGMIEQFDLTGSIPCWHEQPIRHSLLEML